MPGVVVVPVIPRRLNVSTDTRIFSVLGSVLFCFEKATNCIKFICKAAN